MNSIWKVTATKDQAQVASGMWVEIVKKSSLIGPTPQEVLSAIKNKYGLTSIPSGIGGFLIVKL